MQFCANGSLDARIRERGPLPVAEVLHHGVRLAGAIETAHRAGILHRDIKPANILLDDYGDPLLGDFGIARVAGGFATESRTITASPAFTAPEVLEGEPPTVASDVYGLGATLFSAMTGHAAFERRTGEQLVAQFVRITTEPIPDLRERGFPPDVCAAIEHAMARRRADRFPTAALFGDELRRIQRQRGIPIDAMVFPAAATTAEPEAAGAPAPRPRPPSADRTPTR